MDVAGHVEYPRLALAQGSHDLEALDRRVGRLHRLEASYRADQNLEFAVIGFDDVV